MEFALHIWTLDGVDIVHVSNRVLRTLLRSTPPPPLPFQALGVHEVVLPENFWVTNNRLQQDTLPIFSDLLFRLQHNGLGFDTNMAG